ISYDPLASPSVNFSSWTVGRWYGVAICTSSSTTPLPQWSENVFIVRSDAISDPSPEVADYETSPQSGWAAGPDREMRSAAPAIQPTLGFFRIFETEARRHGENGASRLRQTESQLHQKLPQEGPWIDLEQDISFLRVSPVEFPIASRLDPHSGRRGEMRVRDVAGVARSRRLEDEDFGFRVGDRSVFDATRHDDELPRSELDDMIPELDP